MLELPRRNRALPLSCSDSIGCSSEAEGCSLETCGNSFAVSSWICEGSCAAILVSLQHPAGGGVSSNTAAKQRPPPFTVGAP